MDSMRIAILNAYYQQPSFILRVLEATNHPSNPVNPPSSPIPPSPQDIPSWCRCTHCREMPSEVEKRCCNQIPRNCHSRLLVSFSLCTSKLAIEFAGSCLFFNSHQFITYIISRYKDDYFLILFCNCNKRKLINFFLN